MLLEIKKQNEQGTEFLLVLKLGFDLWGENPIDACYSTMSHLIPDIPPFSYSSECSFTSKTLNPMTPLSKGIKRPSPTIWPPKLIFTLVCRFLVLLYSPITSQMKLND